MAIPKFFDFFVPTLKVLYNAYPNSVQAKELYDIISQEFSLSEEEKSEMLPSGKQATNI